MTDIADATTLLEANGYTVVLTSLFRRAQERQRIAEVRMNDAFEQRDSAERWARECRDDERRIRDRLTFVWGIATAHGATLEELRDLPAAGTAP